MLCVCGTYQQLEPPFRLIKGHRAAECRRYPTTVHAPQARVPDSVRPIRRERQKRGIKARKYTISDNQKAKLASYQVKYINLCGGGGIRTHEEEQPPTAFRVPRTRPDYATPPESPGLYPPGRRSSLTRPGLIRHRTLAYSVGAIRGPGP